MVNKEARLCITTQRRFLVAVYFGLKGMDDGTMDGIYIERRLSSRGRLLFTAPY